MEIISGWLQRTSPTSAAFRIEKSFPTLARGGQPCHGVVLPIGVDAEGGLVAAASWSSPTFPSEIDQLLLSGGGKSRRDSMSERLPPP